MPSGKCTAHRSSFESSLAEGLRSPSGRKRRGLPDHGERVYACGSSLPVAGPALSSRVLRPKRLFGVITDMNLPQFVRWATGIRWQWKVFIPIIAVLAISLVAILALLRSLEIREFQWILLAGVACAILLCFVLLSVLLVLVERPLEELTAGLAHEIRNPLAGIAGVVDVMGKELPPHSPSRAVLGEVRREVLHIQTILNDLLSYARPRPPDFHP